MTLSPGGKIKSKFQASTVQCKPLVFFQTSSSSNFPEQKEQINTFTISVIMPLHFSINWSICIKTLLILKTAECFLYVYLTHCLFTLLIHFHDKNKILNVLKCT